MIRLVFQVKFAPSLNPSNKNFIYIPKRLSNEMLEKEARGRFLCFKEFWFFQNQANHPPLTVYLTIQIKFKGTDIMIDIVLLVVNQLPVPLAVAVRF
jgi:hypothetical protein